MVQKTNLKPFALQFKTYFLMNSTRGDNMQISEAKQKLDEIIKVLSESKLSEIIDFANYLKNKEEMEDIFRMQAGSRAYMDWLSSENDIYDEVFKDEIKQG